MKKTNIFVKSIINESNKVLLQKKTIIIFLFIFLFAILNGIYHLKSQSNNEQWKNNLNNKITANQKKIAEWEKEYNEETDEKKKKVYLDFIADFDKENTIFKYAVDNNIPYNVVTVWKFVYYGSSITFAIFIYIILVSSSILSNEYSLGTIKQTAIKPIKRWKLLTSKFIALISFNCLLFVFLFLTRLLVGFILFNKNGFGNIDIILDNNMPIERNVIQYTLTTYFLDFIKLIVISSFAFMISVLSRSTTLALTSALILFLSSNLIAGLLSDYSLGKYTLFPNLNLKQFLLGNSVVTSGLSLKFSVIILSLHFIAFSTMSLLTFEKRDIV